MVSMLKIQIGNIAYYIYTVHIHLISTQYTKNYVYVCTKACAHYEPIHEQQKQRRPITKQNKKQNIVFHSNCLKYLANQTYTIKNVNVVRRFGGSVIALAQYSTVSMFDLYF